MTRYLIFNADDLGASTGINAAIRDCHLRGVVTSASLMVTGRALDEATAIAREHPALSVGLHWDVWGENEREFDLSDRGAARDEFHRQVEAFERRLGRLPTHIDSHQHAHTKKPVRSLFRELCAELSLPLRDTGDVRFRGGFYGQWEWQVTDLQHIELPYLQWMLRNEVPDGWTEFSCHPGYRSDDFTSIYLDEREVEVRTLMDPAVRDTISELGIQLVSYHDYHRITGHPPAHS